MSSPVGHTIVGLLLARRLGVTSPLGTAASVIAASWPDADTIVSFALHGDPWKLHRKRTHTLNFALTSGMLAGSAGLISRGSAEGERDLVADALAGAMLVGSHILLDALPLPYLKIKDEAPISRAVVARSVVWNWTLDAVVYGLLARRFWPRSAG